MFTIILHGESYKHGLNRICVPREAEVKTSSYILIKSVKLIEQSCLLHQGREEVLKLKEFKYTYNAHPPIPKQLKLLIKWTD